jgi:hypothetical protein
LCESLDDSASPIEGEFLYAANPRRGKSVKQVDGFGVQGHMSISKVFTDV